jgi:hypothetical protein
VLGGTGPRGRGGQRVMLSLLLAFIAWNVLADLRWRRTD